MKLNRVVYPLLFAFALLFAQQGGVAHSVSHALSEQTQQQDKQTPHQHTCEQCEAYAQLGSALNSNGISFALHDALSYLFSCQHYLLLTSHSLAASARGPPDIQKIA